MTTTRKRTAQKRASARARAHAGTVDDATAAVAAHDDVDANATTNPPKRPRVDKPSSSSSSSTSHPYSGYRHWLMKNEPPFSCRRLAALDPPVEPWVGVRNYEACNIMRVHMRPGDQVFYYEANIAQPHISGIAEVCSAPYPDPTAFDRSSKYFDAKFDRAKPRWYLIDVRFVRFLQRPVTLAELRHAHAQDDSPLAELCMLRRNRLSISPVSHSEWDHILAMETAQSALPAARAR